MSSSGPASEDYWTARRVRASGSSILLALLMIVGVVVIGDLVSKASQPIGWVVAAVVTALVLWPLVERLDAVLPRGLGIFLALILTAAMALGLFLAVNRELRGQLDGLERRLPAAAQKLEDRQGEDGVLRRLRFGTLVGDVVEETSERVAPEPSVQDAAGTAPSFLASGILVIFFLIWGPKMLAGGLRQISDDDLRSKVASIAGRSARLTQGYLAATIGVGALTGLAAGGLAWAVGLPTPLVLGVVVGMASTVPYLGVLFGSVPLLLLAAASEPGIEVAALALALIALQAGHTAAFGLLEGRGLLRAGPAVIVVCAIVGSDAYGLGGALVAVVGGIFAIAAIEAGAGPEPEPVPEVDADAVADAAETASSGVAVAAV